MGKKRSFDEPGHLPQALNQSLGGIEEPKTILDACLPALRKQFDQSKLGFTPSRRADRITRYALSGVNQNSGTAREIYPVHTLCRKAETIYWAGVTVDFQFLNSSHQLVDAGIVIFEGRGFAPKVPVLRAEWHCSDDYLKAIHAQPHWHVYHPPPQYLRAGFSPDSPKDFTPDEQVKDEGNSEAQLMSFHFAMSAGWQSGEQNAHIAPLTSETALRGWLCGCLSYIAGQLS